MPHIDTGQALTLFLGNLPTFITVILAWMHSNGRFSDAQSRMSDMNNRMSDMNNRISDTNNRMSDMKSDLQRQIVDLKAEMKADGQTTRDILRAEFRRVGEVMGARLKHLEEHER
jgi:predicted  nucleic acid-binding Zn-ribbon protein